VTLATYTEANHWLDQNKLKFTDAQDAVPEATNADRYIRAKLADSFTAAIVNGWDESPTGAETATPALVRMIAAMLMASFRYAKKYSEETLDENDYSARLKQDADELLDQIASGELVLFDTTLVQVDIFAQADFWPNDSTVYFEDPPAGKDVYDPIRFAGMEDRF
jgi:hypothetical protein